MCSCRQERCVNLVHGASVLSNCSRIYRLCLTLFCMTMFFSAIGWIAEFIIFHEHVASCVSGGCRRGPGDVNSATDRSGPMKDGVLRNEAFSSFCSLKVLSHALVLD